MLNKQKYYSLLTYLIRKSSVIIESAIYLLINEMNLYE